MKQRLADTIIGIASLISENLPSGMKAVGPADSEKSWASASKNMRRLLEITQINLRAAADRKSREESATGRFEKGEAVHPRSWNHQYEESSKGWVRRIFKRTYRHVSVHLAHRKDCRRCQAERRVCEARQAEKRRLNAQAA